MPPRSQGHLRFIADKLDKVHAVPYLIKFILG